MLRSDFPLGQIYSTKNLAKKVSRDQDFVDKTNLVGPAKDLAVLGKVSIRLKAFRELYRKLLKELTKMQEDLFGGISFDNDDWIKFEVPDQLADEPGLNNPGYNFGEEETNRLKKYEYAGLNVLLHHPRFKDWYSFMVVGEKFVPNAVTCHNFLKRASLARSKLATLTHILVGGPPRGTESTSHHLRNHPQGDLRNVQVINDDLSPGARGHLPSGYIVSSL